MNVKYKILETDKKNYLIEQIRDILNKNLGKERKYEFNDSLCLYRIEDFISNENKIFIINFYMEKNKNYDFCQKFLGKFVLKDDELIYILDNVGYVFITDLFVKGFGFFWRDFIENYLQIGYVELKYKNF